MYECRHCDGASLIVLPATVVADDDTRLFKDWHYVQHKDEFPRSQGYYDFTGDARLIANNLPSDLRLERRPVVAPDQQCQPAWIWKTGTNLDQVGLPLASVL